MSGNVVPWRIPVLNSTNGKWAYQWGYFAWLEKAHALMKSKKPIEAYDALINAGAYMSESPPKPFDKDYWLWYALIGDVCEQFNRNFDAEQYLNYARQNLETNDETYLYATAKLASLYGYRGDFSKSRKLYKKLFQLRPNQPKSVWKDYIRLLFNSGDFEEGIKMIFQGVEMNGISSQYMEDDYFIMLACRYWLLFDTSDVSEWYKILGKEIKKVKSQNGNENLISFLLRTRKMIAKVYPDILPLPNNDLSEFKKQPLSEKKYIKMVANQKNIVDAAIEKDSSVIIPANSYQWYENDTNTMVEKAVNNTLYEARKMSKCARGKTKTWQNILENFTTNQLSVVNIDGETALFIIYSQTGVILWDEHKNKEAIVWLKKALELTNKGQNNFRHTQLLLCLSESCFRLKKFEDGDYYLTWANEMVGDNMRQFLFAKSALAFRAYSKDGIKSQIKILEEIVGKCGCLVRQKDFKQLSADYYSIGDYKKGFNTLVETIKRQPIRLFTGYYSPMYNSIKNGRSFLSVNQLEQYRKLLRTSTLKIPNTPENEMRIEKIFEMADQPWIDEEIKLAIIQENKNFSNKNFLIISNNAFHSTSIRAALLYTDAQAAREANSTNQFDWSGWVKGWNIINRELGLRFHPGIVDYMFLKIIDGKFIDQLEKYKNRISKKDFLILFETFRTRADKLSNKHFDEMLNIFKELVDDETLFQLYYMRMSNTRKNYPNQPAYQKMIELCGKLNPEIKNDLLCLLNRKLHKEKKDDLKSGWVNLIDKVKNLQ